MKNWKQIIGSVAPTLATALGGPFVGMATKLISNKVLGKDNGTDAELMAAFSDPESLAALKQAEYDFEVKLKELGIEKDRLTIQDRASARRLATDTSILPQSILSAVVILGFFWCVHMLLNLPDDMDDQSKMMLSGLFGCVSTLVTIVIKFWFGGGTNDGSNLDRMHNSVPSEKIGKK